MQTLDNGIEVPTNGDNYNLTEHLAGMGGTSNVVRIVPSESVRDSIAEPYAGLPISRTDLPGAPLQVYDGTNWSNVPTVEATTLIQGSDPGFVVSGIVTKTRIGDLTQVILSGRITRAVASDASSINKTIPNLVPDAYRPFSTADWPTNLLTAGGLIRLHVNAFVAPNGNLTVTHDTAAYVMNPGDYWTLQASWWL